MAFLITPEGPDYGPSRHPHFRTLTRGVRVEADVEDWWDEVAGFALVLPKNAAFSHTTAARIGGLPLPLMRPRPLHVTVPGSRGTRKGIVWHKGDLEGRVEVYRGLRITRPLPTWHALGRCFRSRNLWSSPTTSCADAW